MANVKESSWYKLQGSSQIWKSPHNTRIFLTWEKSKHAAAITWLHLFCSLLTVGSSESPRKGFGPWTSTGHHAWPFSSKKRLRQAFPAAQGLSNAGVIIFTEKKHLRQAFPTAQGLSNLREATFDRENTAAARLPGLWLTAWPLHGSSYM